MISHPVREEVFKAGSLVVYYLWESLRVEIPFVRNFYWHDKSCTRSVGPFASLSAAMESYANAKKAKKALRQHKIMQELQKTDPLNRERLKRVTK